MDDFARWTSPELEAYVVELMRLAEASPHPGRQSAFDEVLRQERELGRMTREG